MSGLNNRSEPTGFFDAPVYASREWPMILFDLYRRGEGERFSTGKTCDFTPPWHPFVRCDSRIVRPDAFSSACSRSTSAANVPPDSASNCSRVWRIPSSIGFFVIITSKKFCRRTNEQLTIALVTQHLIHTWKHMSVRNVSTVLCQQIFYARNRRRGNMQCVSRRFLWHQRGGKQDFGEILRAIVDWNQREAVQKFQTISSGASVTCRCLGNNQLGSDEIKFMTLRRQPITSLLLQGGNLNVGTGPRRSMAND